VIVLKDKAVDALLSPNFKVGGDASVAAGPVGVGASGTINADMVSFSRAKGVYAGLSLDGAVIRPDADANAAFYGKPASPADILVRGGVSNADAAALQRMVAEAAR
jgi:lipid-binding SYLF domain-containing protein